LFPDHLSFILGGGALVVAGALWPHTPTHCNSFGQNFGAGFSRSPPHYFSTHFEGTHTWQFQLQRANADWEHVRMNIFAFVQPVFAIR
jgi:hypothetical protein